MEVLIVTSRGPIHMLLTHQKFMINLEITEENYQEIPTLKIQYQILMEDMEIHTVQIA